MLLEKHDHIELNDECYEIINNHRNYITALKVLRSRDILDEDKIEAVMPLLFAEPIPEGLEVKAITEFFTLFSDKKSNSKEKPSFEIIQDAEYIYAGFMQTYGIDLDETEMPIEKFIALLKGLPSDTRLAEIVRIRTMPIPQRTKYNAENIAGIIRMKRDFALDNNEEIKGLTGFAKMVKEWAEHGR